MLKKSFIEYIKSTNLETSNKAQSYIRALDLLCIMLQIESFGFDDCVDIWMVNSPKRIHDLYKISLREKRNFHHSPWNIEELPSSYLKKGFCSAALKHYECFLNFNRFENHLFNAFDEYKGAEEMLPVFMDEEFSNYEDMLIESDQEGHDVIKKVKVRVNHHVFKKMLRKIYMDSCCITGLKIPELNRASHIIPWSENTNTRLDPRNGLYLSATYDAAFDNHLISLDDDYRIIVSKSIKDYAEQSIVDEYFIKKEGMVINLPDRYRPKLEYLDKHRNRGEF